MPRIIRLSLALSLPFCIASCAPKTDASDDAPTIDTVASKAVPTEPARVRPVPDTVAGTTQASETAVAFPVALRGTWRETSGAAPTPVLCDNTRASNMGKVLNIRADSYSYFEEGGRFLEVLDRTPGRIRAVFDTTYADRPTRDELTFAVDPVARTLTVTNHDGETHRTVTYKRCPE
ncbi:MAG: hypothetical protein WA954_11775 [Parerythrobacter sp.]